MLEVLFLELANPGRGDEGLGFVVLAAGDEDGAAEGVLVGDVLGECLAVVALGFAAHVVVGAGFDPEAAVAGAVGEELGADDEVVLGEVAHGAHGLDHAILDLGADDIGVEEQGDVGFKLHLLVEQQIPLRVAACGVAHGVLEAEFLDETGLAAAGFSAVAVGADDVHLDLAGGVAAEHGTVLNENDAGAATGGRDGGADAGKSAAGDKKIGFDGVEGIGH